MYAIVQHKFQERSQVVLLLFFEAVPKSMTGYRRKTWNKCCFIKSRGATVYLTIQTILKKMFIDG